MSITPDLRHGLENVVRFGGAFAGLWCVAVYALRLRKHPDITMAGAQKFRSRLRGLALVIVACQLGAYKTLEWIPTRDVVPRIAPSRGPVPAPSAASEAAQAGDRQRVRLGDYARIVCSPGSSCVAAASEQDERDIEQAERKKSRTGGGQTSHAEKEALGRAYRIKSGTNAVAFGTGTGAAGADVSHIYLEVGPDSVMEGWIPSGWLRKQPLPR